MQHWLWQSTTRAWGVAIPRTKRANYRVQRKRIARWYTSLFYWAVNVMVISSYVIFCSEAIEIISHKKYRLVLAKMLMQSGTPPAVAEAKAEPCPKRLKPNEPKPKQRHQGGHHALERLEKSKGCVECKVVSRTQYGCDVCKRAMHIECFRAWHTE